MEDKFIKEFENFYDIQLLIDYGNKIRTEIINGLEDLRKRNDNFPKKMILEESRLWSTLKNNFRDFNIDNSEEKVKRLNKLIEIYTCFSNICRQIYYTRDDVKHIKFLINRE